MLPFAVLAASLAVLALGLLGRRFLAPRRLAGFPHLSGTLWFVGDFPAAIKHMRATKQWHLYFEKLYESFDKRTFQFFFLGSMDPVLFVGDAATAESSQWTSRADCSGLQLTTKLASLDRSCDVGETSASARHLQRLDA